LSNDKGIETKYHKFRKETNCTSLFFTFDLCLQRIFLLFQQFKRFDINGYFIGQAFFNSASVHAYKKGKFIEYDPFVDQFPLDLQMIYRYFGL